jgi:aminoglycoside phosphotransferase (APT) family kinase protein
MLSFTGEGALPHHGEPMTDEARIHIDASVVVHLIATQFPRWGGLPVWRVDSDGWDNSTFRLGDDMKVRLPTAAKYAQQVAKECRYLPQLAPLLPLPISVPLAMGAPDDDYPWPWAIYSWVKGDTATPGLIDDQSRFAIDVAEFLLALQRIDATDGPPAGPQTFYRGGSLSVYDAEVRQCTEVLRDEIDADGAIAVWEVACASPWHGPAVWVHGDIAASNLIVENGSLSAVIDFGCCAVGDPACDLTIAWTLLCGKGREAFRGKLSVDKFMWARARGWALWKALLILAKSPGIRAEQDNARGVIASLLAEHRRETS